MLNLPLSVTPHSCTMACLVNGLRFSLQSWHWLTHIVHEVFFHWICVHSENSVLQKSLWILGVPPKLLLILSPPTYLFFFFNQWGIRYLMWWQWNTQTRWEELIRAAISRFRSPRLITYNLIQYSKWVYQTWGQNNPCLKNICYLW